MQSKSVSNQTPEKYNMDYQKSLQTPKNSASFSMDPEPNEKNSSKQSRRSSLSRKHTPITTITPVNKNISLNLTSATPDIGNLSKEGPPVSSDEVPKPAAIAALLAENIALSPLVNSVRKSLQGRRLSNAKRLSSTPQPARIVPTFAKPVIIADKKDDTLLSGLSPLIQYY